MALASRKVKGKTSARHEGPLEWLADAFTGGPGYGVLEFSCVLERMRGAAASEAKQMSYEFPFQVFTPGQGSVKKDRWASRTDPGSALEGPRAEECFLHFRKNCLREEGGEDGGGGGGTRDRDCQWPTGPKSFTPQLLQRRHCWLLPKETKTRKYTLKSVCEFVRLLSLSLQTGSHPKCPSGGD